MDKELDEEKQVIRGGVRKGGGRRKSATQPGPYRLGESFFGKGGGG